MTVTPIRSTRHWFLDCQLSANGISPIPNLFNAVLPLRRDPQWMGTLRYDQMRCTVMLNGSPAEDSDVFQIHHWMQDNGLKRMGLEAVREAVELVGRENPFHPIKQWLETLPPVWDGTLRLLEWLPTYCGTPNDDYHREIGLRFLIQMVKRVMQPGCQADYMLVLIGDQGELKSQVCRTLASDDYFSSHLPDLAGDAVRLSMHLRGKWLIEVAELAAFASNHIRAEHLKAFVTRQVEQYTPKHARKEVHEKRQCVLVGTTNDPQCLKDETGNRRFWPVICGTIELEKLKQDREQLMAEAFCSFLGGAQSWPDRKFEKQFIEPIQQQHLWLDAWADPVRDWLSKQIKNYYNSGSLNPLKLTLSAIADGALNLRDSDFDPAKQKRLSTVLKHLKWTPKRTTTERFWIPP